MLSACTSKNKSFLKKKGNISHSLKILSHFKNIVCLLKNKNNEALKKMKTSQKLTSQKVGNTTRMHILK